MYLLKVRSKNIFCLVSILKVLTKRAGLELDLDRYASQTYGFGSGTVPKCPGSRTLIILNYLSCAQLHFWVFRVKTVVAVIIPCKQCWGSVTF